MGADDSRPSARCGREDVFLACGRTAVNNLVVAADPEDTVAMFSHDEVINVLLHDSLRTAPLLSLPPSTNTSLTRRLY